MGLPNATDPAGNAGGQVWSTCFPDPNNPKQWFPWFPLGPNVFPPRLPS
jgi:hypothetical protein